MGNPLPPHCFFFLSEIKTIYQFNTCTFPHLHAACHNFLFTDPFKLSFSAQSICQISSWNSIWKLSVRCVLKCVRKGKWSNFQMTQLTRPACMGLIGWDRLAGTGVATAQKIVQRHSIGRRRRWRLSRSISFLYPWHQLTHECCMLTDQLLPMMSSLI